MTPGVVHEKNRHAMTYVVCLEEHTCNGTGVVHKKNRHAMTLHVVCEKNKHAMKLVDPCIVHEKN